MRLTVLRFDALASTNTEAARQAERGASEGLCVVAREQTAGRGRQERAWSSPLDAGLYFSIVLRPRLPVTNWPLITLMAALAVADALEEACALRADIKWPNDIYANGRKLCGILAETVETQAGRAIVLGIGINLNDRAFPPELKDVATSVEALTKSEIDVETLLHALTRSLALRYDALQAEGGPARILSDWSARSSYAEGKRVRVALMEEILEGVTRGLESDGALRVETDYGEIRIVRAGDVWALRAEGRKENEEL